MTDSTHTAAQRRTLVFRGSAIFVAFVAAAMVAGWQFYGQSSVPNEPQSDPYQKVGTGKAPSNPVTLDALDRK